jgi:ABC-type thiamin/hydroxymethylpyrimidine transport system permease subunit
MLPIESLRGFRKQDFLALGLMIVTWIILITLSGLVGIKWRFLVEIFFTVLVMSFAALLIRRIGAVVVLLLVGSLILNQTDALDGLGVSSIPVLVVAGIIFEFVIVVLKKEIKNVPLNFLVGSGLASASMPWTMFFLVESNVALSSFVSFSLTLFFVGLVGSVVAYMIWYEIKNTKPVLKYEYSV